MENTASTPPLYFRSADRQIVSRIKHQGFGTCRTTIAPSYINHALNKFRKGFILQTEDKIDGFCLWVEKNSGPGISKRSGLPLPNVITLHILLICAAPSAKHTGTKLIQAVDEYCIKNGISFVTLEPANDGLIPFYERQGFLITRDSRLQHIMMKNVSPYIIPPGRSTTRKQRGKQLNRIEDRYKQGFNYFNLSPEEARRLNNFTAKIEDSGELD